MKGTLSEYTPAILWTLLVLAVGSWLYFGTSDNLNEDKTETSSYSAPSRSSDSYGIYDNTESYSDYDTMYDNAYDEWDTVREYIDGTYTIDACSDSGCYSLDADISSGDIETIYFPNGGYIYPDAEIESDGSASGYDSDGNSWDFTIDSYLIDDAIENWIEDNKEDFTEYTQER